MVELTQRQEGAIWAAVRRGLNHAAQDLKAAHEATRYEEESIHLDSASRRIANLVVSELNGTLKADDAQ